MLQCINRATENDWRAAARFLEIAFPAEYRRADARVEVNTNAQAGEVQHARAKASVGWSARISSIKAKMLFKSHI
jgi:hypothetical protein